MPDANGKIRGIVVPAAAWDRVFAKKLHDDAKAAPATQPEKKEST